MVTPTIDKYGQDDVMEMTHSVHRSVSHFSLMTGKTLVTDQAHNLIPVVTPTPEATPVDGDEDLRLTRN